MLYAMAMNRGRDALRRRQRSRIVYLDEVEGRGDDVMTHDPTAAMDERAQIEAALDRVQPPFQEAVYLRDLVGLSYEEAARALGVSLGTVKSRVNRGRMAFRDHYFELSSEDNHSTRGGHYAS